MELDLDDDLLAFRDAVRRLCAERFGAAAARQAASGLDRASWRLLAEMGLFSAGELGAVALVVAHEELGRALVAGPVVATALADGLIDGARTGETIVAAVEGAPGNHAMVAHLPSADVLLRLDAGGIWRADAAEVRGEEVTALDPTATAARAALPLGRAMAGNERAAELRRRASLLVSAHLVGSSAASTALAAAYAGERTQFGRRIGSFQAVKHLLADAHARTEVARAALHAAAVVVDDPSSGDATRLVAGARVLATAAGIANARTAIQVHGGMGFTWEVDAHLHLKRCWSLESAFGSSSEAAATVAERVLAG
jgi:alkylation response protein AidB-like acyl-CoA dehydrogenase